MEKHKANYTPEGYRVDPIKQEKFLLATKGGAELGPSDATGCEVELWQIREKLLKAAKATHKLLTTEKFDTSDGLVARCKEIAQLTQAAIHDAEQLLP